MHCPQCGQQQLSGDLRFCSRCGFPLAGVNELLATGGALPTQEVATGRRRRSPRYEGVRQGILMFFLGALIVPLLAIINSFQVNGSTMLDLLVPISAILFFVGGFVRILYALIFEEGMPAGASLQSAALPYVPPAASTRLGTNARGNALPPAQSIPVSSWRQPHDTAEMFRPPSVTENTTRLLNDPPEQPPR
jgi:hypothetical protein